MQHTRLVYLLALICFFSLAASGQQAELDARIQTNFARIVNKRQHAGSIYNANGSVRATYIDSFFFGEDNRMIRAVRKLMVPVRQENNMYDVSWEALFTTQGLCRIKVSDPYLKKKDAIFYFSGKRLLFASDPDSLSSDYRAYSIAQDKRYLLFDGTYALKWNRIGNGSIARLHIGWGNSTYVLFRKGKYVICVPLTLRHDFEEILLSSPAVFDLLVSKGVGLSPMDSSLDFWIENHLEQLGVLQVVTFYGREITFENQSYQQWYLEILRIASPPCTTLITVRKEGLKNRRLTFKSMTRPVCMIP